MARTLNLAFTDGSSESVTLNTRALIEAERKFGDVGAHPIESTLYSCWFRLGRPGGNFDGWLDTVDLDASKESTDESGPTPPEASEGS